MENFLVGKRIGDNWLSRMYKRHMKILTSAWQYKVKAEMRKQKILMFIWM